MNETHIHPSAVIETIQVSAVRLYDNRTHRSPKSAHWQRFVAVRTDALQCAAMEPLLSTGAVVVIDRHYNSMASYRTHQPTLYAVRCGRGLLLRFLELDAGNLILRPSSMDFPIQILPLATNESPADYIVGRVCLIVSEL
jgi:hypothetical protein